MRFFEVSNSKIIYMLSTTTVGNHHFSPFQFFTRVVGIRLIYVECMSWASGESKKNYYRNHQRSEIFDVLRCLFNDKILLDVTFIVTFFYNTSYVHPSPYISKRWRLFHYFFYYIITLCHKLFHLCVCGRLFYDTDKTLQIRARIYGISNSINTVRVHIMQYWINPPVCSIWVISWFHWIRIYFVTFGIEIVCTFWPFWPCIEMCVQIYYRTGWQIPFIIML